MMIEELKEEVEDLSMSDSNPSEDQIDLELLKERKTARRKSFDVK
jgi:hypothetical protein